ncbi:HTH-type transcriptional regulator [Methylophaga lonarensis MPL]|uniref:HTH-type transcriptional regulator n=1 Tax=Methylophaga lonarensis MPL TaxID=1286106 RepID=M7PT64_9GAMM|nr:LysR family transcriptional regulator [Methylophaga lonarensis]EMR13659.1 HTH-type transcriptional regulator [Methylophaga lonarensis MPL]
MRVEQVEAFVKTAEHGSFAKAAMAMGMQRSTVSAAVSSLEDELAIPLFERSGNSLQITPVGQSLLADSQRLLQSATRIKQLSTQHLEGIESELRIARDDALPEVFWHQCMHDLHAAFPQTSTSVYLLPTQEHQEFIDSGIVDISFGVNHTVDPAFRLGMIEQRTVVSPTHPLANLAQVTESDLSQYTQICLTFLQRGQLVVQNQIGRQYSGLTMYELIRDAVLRGDGWAILPSTLTQPYLSQQQLVSLATETALSATFFQCLSRQANQKAATWLKNRVADALTHEFKAG